MLLRPSTDRRPTQRECPEIPRMPGTYSGLPSSCCCSAWGRSVPVGNRCRASVTSQVRAPLTGVDVHVFSRRSRQRRTGRGWSPVERRSRRVPSGRNRILTWAWPCSVVRQRPNLPRRWSTSRCTALRSQPRPTSTVTWARGAAAAGKATAAVNATTAPRKRADREKGWAGGRIPCSLRVGALPCQPARPTVRSAAC